MNYKSIVKTGHWQEIKKYFEEEIQNKPFDIKTENLSAERIAIEVRASQLAIEKIKKAITKFERLGQEEKQSERYI